MGYPFNIHCVQLYSYISYILKLAVEETIDEESDVACLTI